MLHVFADVDQRSADLADAHGLENLTLAQVASAVGVRLPSLYNHVQGLEGLHRDLALLAAEDLVRVLGHAAIGKIDNNHH